MGKCSYCKNNQDVDFTSNCGDTLRISSNSPIIGLNYVIIFKGLVSHNRFH